MHQYSLHRKQGNGNYCRPYEALLGLNILYILLFAEILGGKLVSSGQSYCQREAASGIGCGATVKDFSAALQNYLRSLDS